MTELSVQLASWPERDELVAEIWRGDEYIADATVEPHGVLVTFRAVAGQDGITVDLVDLMAALEKARRVLTS